MRSLVSISNQWLVLALAASLVACGERSPRPPDVVLIELNGVRVDHVGKRGYSLPTDRGLAAFGPTAQLRGVARSPSSSTRMASAALLTGRYPSPLREGPAVDPALPTLAERLRDAGWLTWGLSQHPQISADEGFGRGFDTFESARGDPLDRPDGALAVDRVREWLSESRPPFFLYLHLADAHAPYRVPASHRASLLGRPPSDALPYGSRLMEAARQPGRRRAREAIGPERVRSLVEQYDTAVHYAFELAGRALHLLDRAGRLDDALVVVTSNHGEELFDRGGFGHGHGLHEELLRVPIYVRIPDSLSPPITKEISGPTGKWVSTLDVVPTVLDALGLSPPVLDGMSLLPVLRGGERGPTRDFAHVIRPGGPFTLQRALLRGRYKLIDITGAGPQLYDLTLDPEERNDLAAESREIVAELRKALSDALAGR